MAWIEGGFSGQIRPRMFFGQNAPLLQERVHEIIRSELRSISYYRGNPNDRLYAILVSGADGLHLESKKNSSIVIGQMATRVQSQRVLLGNVDAIFIQQNAVEFPFVMWGFCIRRWVFVYNERSFAPKQCAQDHLRGLRCLWREKRS